MALWIWRPDNATPQNNRTLSNHFTWSERPHSPDLCFPPFKVCQLSFGRDAARQEWRRVAVWMMAGRRVKRSQGVFAIYHMTH